MSPECEGTAAFEQRVRVLLEEGAQRVSGRVRSRLNQSRQAALAQAARRRGFAASPRWMPATGAVAAAALIALLLWSHRPQAAFPAVEASHARAEDLDLLADRDGLDLMQGGDGQFYEWAMAQALADPSGHGAVRRSGQRPGSVPGSGSGNNSG